MKFTVAANVCNTDTINHYRIVMLWTAFKIISILCTGLWF